MRGPLSKNSSITCELNSLCFGREANIGYLSLLINRLKEMLLYFSGDQILRKCAFRLKIDYRIVRPSDNRCWNPRPIPITSTNCEFNCMYRYFRVFTDIHITDIHMNSNIPPYMYCIQSHIVCLYCVKRAIKSAKVNYTFVLPGSQLLKWWCCILYLIMDLMGVC